MVVGVMRDHAERDHHVCRGIERVAEGSEEEEGRCEAGAGLAPLLLRPVHAFVRHVREQVDAEDGHEDIQPEEHMIERRRQCGVVGCVGAVRGGMSHHRSIAQMGARLTAKQAPSQGATHPGTPLAYAAYGLGMHAAVLDNCGDRHSHVAGERLAESRE